MISDNQGKRSPQDRTGKEDVMTNTSQFNMVGRERSYVMIHHDNFEHKVSKKIEKVLDVVCSKGPVFHPS